MEIYAEISMEFHGNWCPNVFHGIPWEMVLILHANIFHGNLWRNFHGIPWRFFTRDPFVR